MTASPVQRADHDSEHKWRMHVRGNAAMLEQIVEGFHGCSGNSRRGQQERKARRR